MEQLKLTHNWKENPPTTYQPLPLDCVFPANVRWTFEGLAAWWPQALVPG
jgi:hypothetical protein